MSFVICEYRQQARRAGNYFALGVAMGVSYLALVLDMPRVIWVLISVYLGLVLWRLIRNPTTGFLLRSDRIETMTEGRLRVIPLGHVESCRLSLPRFAPALCLLSLDSGEVVAVRCGSSSHARSLARGLARRGVPEA